MVRIATTCGPASGRRRRSLPTAGRHLGDLFGPRRQPLQLGLHERVQVAVEDTAGVAGLEFGAMVL
jgi:hypothetical protein